MFLILYKKTMIQRKTLLKPKLCFFQLKTCYLPRYLLFLQSYTDKNDFFRGFH